MHSNMPIHLAAPANNIQEKIAFLQEAFLSKYNDSDDRRLDGILTFNLPELKKSKRQSPLVVQIRRESEEYIKIRLYDSKLMPEYKVKQLSKFAENPSHHVILLDPSLANNEVMPPLFKVFKKSTFSNIPFKEIKKVFSSKAILHEIYTSGMQDDLPLVTSQSNLPTKESAFAVIQLIVKNI